MSLKVLYKDEVILITIKKVFNNRTKFEHKNNVKT